jgi:hypothetical protein
MRIRLDRYEEHNKWPDNTDELRHFYPAQKLASSFVILSLASFLKATTRENSQESSPLSAYLEGAHGKRTPRGAIC